jgi:hypothetical protein
MVCVFFILQSVQHAETFFSPYLSFDPTDACIFTCLVMPCNNQFVYCLEVHLSNLFCLLIVSFFVSNSTIK